MGKNYLTNKNYLSTFTISELNGALLRLEEFRNTIKETQSLFNCMVIHKEMAKEGFLTADIDVSPNGMFKADSFERLNERHIYLGMASSEDQSNSISLYELCNLEGLGQARYVFIDQYKQILLDSITEMKRCLNGSLEEALKENAEWEAENENRKNETFFQSIGRRLINMVEPLGQRWNHPGDHNYFQKTQRQMKKEYLQKAGFSEDLIAGIVSGGFEVSLETNLDAIVRPPSVIFKTPSKNEKMAHTEAKYRNALSIIVGKASSNGGVYKMSNLLPIQKINGEAVFGHNQALVRLLMESRNIKNEKDGESFRLTIPVVVNSDDLRSLGELDSFSAENSFFLTAENAMGELVGQRYWFLEDTDFKSVYPTLYESLRALFDKMNRNAQEKPVRAPEDVGMSRPSPEERKGLYGLVTDILGAEFAGDGIRELALADYMEPELTRLVSKVDQQEILSDILVGKFDESVVTKAGGAAIDVLMEASRNKLSSRQGIDLATLDRLNLNGKSSYAAEEGRKIESRVTEEPATVTKVAPSAKSEGKSSEGEAAPAGSQSGEEEPQIDMGDEGEVDYGI